VSLEDEIMRIFGGEQISKVMDFLKIDENQPIEHPMVSKSIESAQVKVESFFFDQRKRLVEFDDVMNKHREIIYQRRRRLLEQSTHEIEEKNNDASNGQQDNTLKKEIYDYLEDEVQAIVNTHLPDSSDPDFVKSLVNEFITIVPFDDKSQEQLEKRLIKFESAPEISQELMGLIDKVYDSREKMLGENMMRQIERHVVLATIDEKWIDHLDQMAALKDGIWLRGDKQTVLSEYKKEAFGMFENLINTVESTVARRIFRVQPARRPVSPTTNLLQQAQYQKEDVNEELSKEVADAQEPTGVMVPQSTQASTSDLAAALQGAGSRTQPGQGTQKSKIGRNDPCPCGSGLKYKDCGLIDAPEHRG
jgi:preprotein translocase subunit SecA